MEQVKASFPNSKMHLFQLQCQVRILMVVLKTLTSQVPQQDLQVNSPSNHTVECLPSNNNSHLTIHTWEVLPQVSN